MIRFEGDRSLPMSPAAAWAQLADASFLVQCVPDGTPAQGATAQRAECKVRPGFAFVRGTMDVVIEIVQATEPKAVEIKLTSKGVGSSSEVLASLKLSDREGGARLHWVADVTQLGGLLKAVPHGLIRGAAQKVIDDLWTRVSQKLAG